MEDSGGLICAYLLNGKGGGTELDWRGVRAWQPDDGPLWVHLDHTGDAANQWVKQESDVGPVIAETLLQDEVRPRLLRI